MGLGWCLPGAWVFRVGCNLAKSYFRRKALERRHGERLKGLSDRQVASTNTEDSLALRQAVVALPKRQRTVLILRYFLDLSVRETADTLGCPEGTVKTLTRKGILTLRESMTDDQGGFHYV